MNFGNKKEKKRIRLKKELTFKDITIITTIIGIILIIINLQFFSDMPQLFAIMNMFVGIIILGVPLIYRYSYYGKIKKIELLFPQYLRDVTENIRSGMTLPQAIRATTMNNYGVLNQYIHDINAKISWGIPFEIVLMDFANDVGSPNIRRTVQTVAETHRSGGRIDSVLQNVVESVMEIEKIKRERSSSVYSQMINGYLIYVIFLGVMVGLSKFLLPTFQVGGEGVPADLAQTFDEMFRALVIIQGFFAGIAIGKMAEGTVVAGIKHSLVLVIFGYSAFLFI